MFDYLFYLNLYPDLRKAGIQNESDAYQHYIKYGKKEGRIADPKKLEENMKQGLQDIQNEYGFYLNNQKQKSEEMKLNILIRTSNRPKYFEKCIKSILEQNYSNYHIYICYDKEESLEYLIHYKNHSQITYFPVNVESKEKYKFNLYCNILMECVKDGWILFLDDDDMYSHTNVFNILNDNIVNGSSNHIYIWKFLRPDKIIYPNNINNINLGEIDTTSFCFHESQKYHSKWSDKQCGDYAFFKNFKLERKFVNYICTRTIDENIIGNFGN